ncbi:MAG: prephenate dehydratase [Alphaproteobacteria bacterium]|nr:prephenate dehydratase [Alphaproteobacteria bacterium]
MPTIAFQGQPGAYSHLACREAYSTHEPLPCESFEAAFEAVAKGDADLAMIPIENSVAGRVADVHHLLPEMGLHIVAEHFQGVRHHLLAPKGATIAGLKAVHSHVHALGQCRKFLREHRLNAQVHADTAGAAADVARFKDPTQAAIASKIAAEIYGLEILSAGIEDAAHNTTRFIVLDREPADPDPAAGLVMTTFVFQVRNVPAALYKALGGFATNRVNMVKLESYMLDGSFSATQFYADIEGHPDDPSVRMALEELGFFSRRVKVLGVYPAHPFRSR